jgi:parallel beta-helix repeat protein
MPVVSALAAALVALVLPVAADAATIEVHPGQNVIHKAMALASPGDTIRIHHGNYPEPFTISKRLRMVAAQGERRPVIDGGCDTRFTIAVRHNGVVLKGLRVVGADEGFGPVPSEVDFHFNATGRAENLVVVDTCDAEYGINVFDTGGVQIVGNRARGFSDAGVYIGGIESTPGDPLRVRTNETHGNNRGIIIEDSLAAPDIRVTANDAHDNVIAGEGTPSGMFLHRSDGIFIAGNVLDDNGDYGVHLDPDSGSNVLSGNSAGGNGIADLFNEGTGNCFGNPNSFGTTLGTPLVACP